MEAETRIKLIIIGLVLGAFAIGYFILTQKARVNSNVIPTPSPNITFASPSPIATFNPEPAPTPLADGSTKGGVETLPKTGFPTPLAVGFASSAMLIGWSLRKYSK